MTELLGSVTLLAGLNNDSLSTGEAAGSDNNNLSTLDAEKEKSEIIKQISCLFIPQLTRMNKIAAMIDFEKELTFPF